MDKKIISVSHKMKGVLDDDYTLYEDGTVLHFYDKHTHPGGLNIKEILTADNLSKEIKQRLLEAAKDENKDLVIKLLKIE